MTLVVPPFTFAAVARQVVEHGWRPFPGLQTSKVPAMHGWSGLNNAEWDDVDLAATIAEYQPTDLYCCCLAVRIPAHCRRGQPNYSNGEAGAD